MTWMRNHRVAPSQKAVYDDASEPEDMIESVEPFHLVDQLVMARREKAVNDLVGIWTTRSKQNNSIRRDERVVPKPLTARPVEVGNLYQEVAGRFRRVERPSLTRRTTTTKKGVNSLVDFWNTGSRPNGRGGLRSEPMGSQVSLERRQRQGGGGGGVLRSSMEKGVNVEDPSVDPLLPVVDQRRTIPRKKGVNSLVDFWNAGTNRTTSTTTTAPKTTPLGRYRKRITPIEERVPEHLRFDAPVSSKVATISSTTTTTTTMAKGKDEIENDNKKKGGVTTTAIPQDGSIVTTTPGVKVSKRLKKRKSKVTTTTTPYDDDNVPFEIPHAKNQSEDTKTMPFDMERFLETGRG